MTKFLHFWGYRYSIWIIFAVLTHFWSYVFPKVFAENRRESYTAMRANRRTFIALKLTHSTSYLFRNFNFCSWDMTANRAFYRMLSSRYAFMPALFTFYFFQLHIYR